jgi:hypothetical protein
MLGALLYLRVTSFANWLKSRLQRLRQPKYLLGAAVGVGYFYFFFFRGFASPPPPTDALAGLPVAGPADWLPLASAIGALALLFFATCMWVVPTERAALGFSEAEIAFLFPAPISRRGLVHFRLISAQLRSLAGATIMTLFSQRWTFLGGNPLTHALGWWFVFSSLNLHLSGARFTLTRLADAGLGLWRRRALLLAALAVVVAVTYARMAPPPAVAPQTTLDLGPVTAWVIGGAETAPLAWLVWPIRLVLAPFLAPDVTAFLLALGPALAVIGLHYLWVVRSALAFEDDSIEQAQQRAARLAAWRAGHGRLHAAPTTARRAPFALASAGPAEIAFLWKNLLSTWPWFNGRVFLIAAGVIAAGGLWLRLDSTLAALGGGLAAMTLMFSGYLLLIGPQFARQDLRSDLTHADLLKTYPLPGWRIVLGELLTPIAILTGLLWLALLAVTLLLPGPADGLAWLTPAVRLVGALGMAALIPALVALQLLVPNAAALLLPGWFHATRTRGGGPEVFGQRMIFFFAQLLTMVLALLPAAAIGAVCFLVHLLVGPVIALLLAGTAMLIVVAAEVAAGIWLLGRRFEHLDLSEELRS